MLLQAAHAHAPACERTPFTGTYGLDAAMCMRALRAFHEYMALCVHDTRCMVSCALSRVRTHPLSRVRTHPLSRVRTHPLSRVRTHPLSRVHTHPLSRVRTHPLTRVRTHPLSRVRTHAGPPAEGAQPVCP